ncbi:MAG: hypothetical protein HZB56_20005 [Deltaproteobacteria bacterium]|nr:hypothetical protein [Deltaproteobacteria bacterium]
MKTLLLALLCAAAAPARASEEAAPAPASDPAAPAPASAPDAAAAPAGAPEGTAAPAVAPAVAAAANTPEGPPAPAPSLFYGGTRWGLQLTAGLPSGAALQVVFRPWKYLRASAGAGYNYLGMGVTGGVTLIPFHWYVTPTLGLEAGHFFTADASRFAGDGDAAARTLLGKVGYDYYSADLGIEFGSENRFVFFLRAGLSELRPTVGDVDAALKAGDPTLRIRTSQPTIKARIPAVRLGFLVYVF